MKLKTIYNDLTRRYLNEETDSTNYNKFPLTALVKQARKFKDFKEFSRFYSIDIYHGYYWHLTDNPNFKISDLTGPRDMSSMTGGEVSEKGAIMLTSDLEYWDEHYNTNDDWKRDVKRNYVALFDASDIEPRLLSQVGRGFGNEVYLDASTAKKLKQIGVYKLNYAKSLERKFDNILPGSEESLLDLWNFAQESK